MATKPTVMLSSTFFDLSQVRADLAGFLDGDLGYRPLLSELPSFPVEPDRDTIENCRRRVKNEADILVLIIGGRYGSIPPEEHKSITNLEYLTARKSGVPVYAFVKEDILNVLPVWEKNPDGDYSNVVDATELFDFVKQVRSRDRIWATGFSTADDIITALRSRFAFLFKEGLKLRRLLRSRRLPSYMEKLEPAALKIALERPEAWEYELFFRVWLDSLDERKDLLREYETGLSIGKSEPVPAESATNWFQTRFHELSGLADSATRLLNVDAQRALGKEGEPGDPELIVWTASRFGFILEEALEWVQRIRRARVEKPFHEVSDEVLKFPDDMIQELQQFPVDTLSAIEGALETASDEEPVTLELTMEFGVSNLDRFNAALEKAEQTYLGR